MSDAGVKLICDLIRELSGGIALLGILYLFLKD